MGEGTAMEGMAVRGRRRVVREEDDAADRWGRSASEGERASERGWQVGLACQRAGGKSFFFFFLFSITHFIFVLFLFEQII
jgi:hypothetical protein